jgi:transcriptional regulator with XRE-family HTH domain
VENTRSKGIDEPVAVMIESKNPRLEWKKQLGLRLREERLRLGLKQRQLADKIGKLKQLVSQWEKGASEITTWDLARLEQLGFDIVYITVGVPASQTNLKLRTPAGLATVVTAASMLQIAKGILTPSEIREKRPVFAQCSDRSLVFAIFDRGMEPNFALGSTDVVVDPEVVPQPGDCVAVCLPTTEEVLFRRYRPGRESKAGMPPFMLRADNEDFPSRSITLQQKPVMLGTLIERILHGSR